MSVPFLASHILTVLSSLPEAMYLPSGLHATEFTLLVWPSRVLMSLPLSASHILTVLSLLPEAILLSIR